MNSNISKWFLIFQTMVCFVICVFNTAVQADVIQRLNPITKVGLPNVDVRRDPETHEINSLALVGHKAGARIRDIASGIEVLRSKMSGSSDSLHVDVHQIGLVKSVINYDSFLTGPQAGDADHIARRFLRHNKGLFGLSNREISNLRITMNNFDETTGVTYIKYEQVVNGLPVFDSEISLTVTGRGEIVIANAGQIIPGAKVNPTPALSIEQGIAAAFKHCGLTLNVDQIQGVESRTESGFAHFTNPLGGGREDIMAMLVVVNVYGQAVVAYRVYADTGSLEWYDTLVDANTGDLVYRFNIWLDAQGAVYTSSPGKNETNARTAQQFVPRFGVSSSDVWLGVTGIPATLGNNVDTYLDRDGNDSPDGDNTTGMLNGHAYETSGDFTFTFDVNDDPRNAKPAVVTNLFYFNNYMHDWMYSLGFTESARNFQLDNYGRGGVENDRVKAEAQDGAGVNNASFGTPPDGESGRMQMFLFTLGTAQTTDDRDSSLDGDVVFHEYGHGVSNRLIGNGSGLNGIQSGAMGEGWSDYWACSNYNDGVMSEYVVNYSAGIRRAPYTVPAAPVHDSYADLGNNGFEVHNDGEIWAVTLWDLNRTLGKTVADKLILDGMKNTPTGPSMINARDGILAADSAVYGNSHKCDIWTVFARHGMGYGASGNDGTTHIASTAIPLGCGGTSCSSSTTAISAGQSLTGSLAITDCYSSVRTGRFYDNFTFFATAGTQYTITLNSITSHSFNIDTYVYLLKDMTVLAENDNGNGGKNSMIVYTPTMSEMLTIHCTSFSTGETGAYTVSLTENILQATSFLINNGASSTTSLTVTLNNMATGSPTECMASESSGFAGAAWQVYSTTPSFTLSPGNGTKTVYFKVKNSSNMESAAVTDSIILRVGFQQAIYTFNEGSGTVAGDSSGNNNHGVINEALWTTGKDGGGLSFDGINDAVTVSGLLGQPQHITLAAWVNLNVADIGGAELISLGDHVALRLDSSNGVKGFYYDGTTWRGTATGLSYAGTGWHHIVYVMDDTNNIQKIYVDGVEKGSTAYTQSISYTGLGSNTFIGRHGNGSANYDFNGIIDDACVYNEALNAQEVFDLYNQSSSGLVSHWKLDEGSGTNATDSIDENNGIISGAVWTTGVSGGALSLDGINDYVDLGNPANLQPGMVSLSVWFKTASAGMIMRKRLYGYGLEVLPSGNISFWIYNAAAAKFTAISPNAYNDNTWHHAVGVYGGSLVKLYMDGFQVASANAGTIFYGAGAIAIGRDGDYNGSYFKGLIDDVRIFQSELSDQAVFDLYNQSSGLVSQWKFDEGIGTIANDWVDGNHGAINGALWTTGKSGGALSFDGNDYVQIPGLLGQPQNITLSAWVQLNVKDTLGAEVISLGDHVAIRLDSSNGAKGFYYDGTTWRGTDTGLSYAGTGWHHVVYVMDDTNNIQKVYIDGVEKGSTAYTQSISYTGLGYNTFIGRHGNGGGTYDFAGIIDDVRVYNKALSAQEVQGLYSSVSAVVTTASHSFMGMNNGDIYTNVIPSETATPVRPTKVILSSFKAEADDGRVILTWETSGETDNAGFNLYRARRRSGTYTQVNNALINPKINPTLGSSYDFVDIPQRRSTYYYKLETVECDGVSTMYGYVKVRVMR